MSHSFPSLFEASILSKDGQVGAILQPWSCCKRNHLVPGAKCIKHEWLQLPWGSWSLTRPLSLVEGWGELSSSLTLVGRGCQSILRFGKTKTTQILMATYPKRKTSHLKQRVVVLFLHDTTSDSLQCLTSHGAVFYYWPLKIISWWPRKLIYKIFLITNIAFNYTA